MVCSTFSDFQRLIKGKFDAYVLRPLAKKLQNWIVDRSTARKFTVPIWIVKVTECLFLKFRLSDKHTKFEKHLPHGLYIYVVNVKTMRKILCASQKVWTLPIWIVDLRGRGSVYQKIFWTRPISNFSISWPKGQEIEIGDQSLVQKIFRYTDPLPLRSTHSFSDHQILGIFLASQVPHFLFCKFTGFLFIFCHSKLICVKLRCFSDCQVI